MSGAGGAFIDSIANADTVGSGDSVKPTMFKMRAQLLDQGRSNMYLAKTKNMWATLKVYASGGENALHAHPSEDHMFVVMEGTARFFGPNDETVDLVKYQGIMLPAGSFYYFQSTSKEPLVLMRVGCRVGPQDPSGRVDMKGEVMSADSAENGREEVIPRPNAYFG